MASKEELLSSINPDMRLTKDFFKKVYGYELSYPGFAEQALSVLEAAGCSCAGKYYRDWVSAYEKEHNAVLKCVAEWYWKNEEGQRRKRGDEVRRQKEQIKSQKWTELSRILGFR
ncbi:MAG: hypothetical protein J1E64_04925 [Acetatifactor sp.]|nr:hypothetical protein [Acetatifactor sp.]